MNFVELMADGDECAFDQRSHECQNLGQPVLKT